MSMYNEKQFCLSQLKMSEKAVAKLADDALFKLYKPVLADDGVYSSFQVCTPARMKRPRLVAWSNRI